MIDPRFIFANLGADVARCVSALQNGNISRYEDSLARSRRTLELLRAANRPEAYEEGLLLIRGIEYARMSGGLKQYLTNVNALVAAGM